MDIGIAGLDLYPTYHSTLNQRIKTMVAAKIKGGQPLKLIAN